MNSFSRFLKLIDKSERVFDTVMPDLSDFAERSSIELIRDSRGRSSIMLTANGTVNEESIPASVSKHAYPYATDKPRKTIDAKNIIFSGTTTAAGTSIISGVTYFAKNNLTFSLSNSLIVNSILFKKGLVLDLACQGTSVIRISPPYTTGSNTRPYSIPYGATGFAYGIESTRPCHSTSIFRFDKFGQFRDQLEQRRDGKFLTKRSPAVESDSPIQCVFVRSDDGVTIVDPYQTDCSNMSTECTSSMPYFDGVARNKADDDNNSSIVFLDATLASSRLAGASPGSFSMVSMF